MAIITMRKTANVISLILICVLLAGCEPQVSLFPLFSSTDDVFENQLLGEWNVQSGSEIKPDEKSGLAIFQRGTDTESYDVTVDLDENGEKLISAWRLVRLEGYLFVDLGSPDLEPRKNATIPYPTIQGHVFGRVHLEKDKMHIDFLNDKWVSDQVKAGKLTLASVTTSNGIALSANTQDLRKFVLEHAEDQDAFSEAFAFQRKK